MRGLSGGPVLVAKVPKVGQPCEADPCEGGPLRGQRWLMRQFAKALRSSGAQKLSPRCHGA